MKQKLELAVKNVLNRPMRSTALVLLMAFLSFTAFSVTIVISSLQKGFTSLEERLGADIMVVPYEAGTRSSLTDIVLQGNTGYFYMNGEVMDKIASMDGIGRITAQYYLASASSSCCSIPVEIIGFDPETDFVITPWIRKSNGKAPGYLDAVVGNDLNAFVGDTLTFYGTDVRVAAKLDKTGTKYDTAVFTDRETIRALIQSSLDKKLNQYAGINAGNVVSCVLVDVAEDADVETVLNDINLHVRKVKAVRTGSMIEGIAGSLDGISRIAGVLSVFIWILTLIILTIAFYMMANERKKEFAILRVIGASRKDLSLIVLLESAALSLAGSMAGVLAGLLAVLPFSGAIEQALQLPFLLPGAGQIAVNAAVAGLLSVLFGAVSSSAAAYRIAGSDTGTILRSEG